MRRVDANEVFRPASHPDESAGLGAVSVHDVRLQMRNQVHEARPNQEVGRVGLAVDGEAPDTELQPRRNLGKGCVGAFAAGQAVGDDADMMAAVGLSIGQIQDVTKDSANGRAHHVQNTKRLV